MVDINDKLNDLISKEQIRQAMARYARGIDRHDEALVRSAYHEDSYDDHGWGYAGSGWELAAHAGRGPDGLPDVWRTTTHFLGQHLIEVEGDRATSEVYYTSQQIFDDDKGLEWSWEVGGRYLDKWERRDEDFKISKRTVIYDWYRTTPNRTPWPGPDHSIPKLNFGAEPANLSLNTVGTTGPDDPSYALMSE
jgi:hypothetical protein